MVLYYQSLYWVLHPGYDAFISYQTLGCAAKNPRLITSGIRPGNIAIID